MVRSAPNKCTGGGCAFGLAERSSGFDEPVEIKETKVAEQLMGKLQESKAFGSTVSWIL